VGSHSQNEHIVSAIFFLEAKLAGSCYVEWLSRRKVSCTVGVTILFFLDMSGHVMLWCWPKY